MSQKTWRMKDGSIVPISGMDDGHLMNTIRLIARHAKYLKRQARRRHDKNHIGKLERDLFGVFCELAFEAKRRGLDKHAPGTGGGAGVIRKDVFQVEPMPTPVDKGRIPRIESKP